MVTVKTIPTKKAIKPSLNPLKQLIRETVFVVLTAVSESTSQRILLFPICGGCLQNKDFFLTSPFFSIRELSNIYSPLLPLFSLIARVALDPLEIFYNTDLMSPCIYLYYIKSI